MKNSNHSFATIVALAIYFPLSLVAFGWYTDDGALASAPEKKCQSHDFCKVNDLNCRKGNHFRCLRIEPTCRNIPACAYCVCDLVFENPATPTIATACHCIKPGMP